MEQIFRLGTMHPACARWRGAQGGWGQTGTAERSGERTGHRSAGLPHCAQRPVLLTAALGPELAPAERSVPLTVQTVNKVGLLSLQSVWLRKQVEKTGEKNSVPKQGRISSCLEGQKHSRDN